MSEMNRVQRWRQQQRNAGKDALTVWLPRELKLYIEDIALKRHCSPADLVEQALTSCYPLSADVTDTVTDTSVTDTSPIRAMFQQELRAFFAASPPYQGRPPVQSVTDTITDTIAHAEAVVSASPETWSITDTVTVTVTDTVTDTTGQAEDEHRVPHTVEHVTDTVTDTLSAPEPTPGVTETVSVTETVTDTVTVTGQGLEPFDTTRYRLGKLCPRGHDYHGSGQTLRKNNKAGGCLACDAEGTRARRQAKRQEVPA